MKSGPKRHHPVFYREAVPSQSPGLPFRLPWVANRDHLYPGLKQRWALGRNRFAVKTIGS
jgi:hypothetical protein